MLNFIRDNLKSMKPSSVRVMVFLIALFLFTLRFFTVFFRERIDILNFVLFSVVLLAILRDDIKTLISKMKGVGFPGLQIPIEDLKNEVNEAEEKYKNLIKRHTDEEELREDLLLNIENPSKTLLNLDFKIEGVLNEIGEQYEKLTRNENETPLTTSLLTDYLVKNDVVGKDVYQIVKRYWAIRTKPENDQELRNLTELAIRLVRLLISILENIKDLKISRSKDSAMFKGSPKAMSLGGKLFEKIDEETVALYTTVNLLDSENNAFPIKQLNKNNFTIHEINSDGKREKVEILDINPVGKKIQLTILLTIDTSASMGENGKLRYTKQAAISLVEKLFKLKNETILMVAIYPFSTENKKGFIDFGEGNVFSSNLEDIKRAILGLKVNGLTPLLDALRYSIEKIESFHGYKAIICLSDGVENASTDTELDYLIEKGENSQIPVYSIGYGEDEYLDFLVEFSKITNAGEEGVGSFMQVAPEKLPNVFDYLAGAIENIYGIYWKPLDNQKKGITKYQMSIEYETKSYGKLTVHFDDLEYKIK